MHTIVYTDPIMHANDHDIIDHPFEILSEIASLDLELEAKVDYSCDQDSLWQIKNQMEEGIILL